MATSNKILLNYLVFDDEDDEIKQNESNIKASGFDCNLNFINPVRYWNQDTNEFEIEKFKSKLIDIVKGKQISLIASDWNMVPETENYKEVNALEIIKILVESNPKFKKPQYLIYSGKPKEVSQVLIKEIQNDISSNDEPIYSKELLSMLLEMKIKFCSRAERFNEINTLINSSKTISLIFLNSLSQFDTNKLHNTGNDDFDGRQIGELLDLISQNNDLGLKFIREIIELSISHYSRLNE
jgi:hypothetical protein